jgi:hypothetical protein
MAMAPPHRPSHCARGQRKRYAIRVRFGFSLVAKTLHEKDSTCWNLARLPFELRRSHSKEADVGK